jgi:hypothetical protein
MRKFGHVTKIADDMDFSWPMHNLDSWEKHFIFHNAGVIAKTAVEDKMFFKGNYVDGKLPFDIKLEDFDENKCTYKYVQEILEVKEKTCLL